MIKFLLRSYGNPAMLLWTEVNLLREVIIAKEVHPAKELKVVHLWNGLKAVHPAKDLKVMHPANALKAVHPLNAMNTLAEVKALHAMKIAMTIRKLVTMIATIVTIAVFCCTGRVVAQDLNNPAGKNKEPMIANTIRVLQSQIMKDAAWAMSQQPETVTAAYSSRSSGGRHDFFSEGDYWWPDSTDANAPYVQRDGLTNPENFVAHRLAMIRFSRIVGALASAYILTKDEKYAKHALLHCRAWFVDTSTMMNPHLLFAQAIKGRATGRGIGIIDTIHFMEVVQALSVIEKLNTIHKTDIDLVRSWFAKYLEWLQTHQYGKDEMNALNNHGTCWVMQVASFAKFTGNTTLMNFCRERYKSVLLPGQMAANGSFPLELKRTKPYGYSIFNLDAMVMICQILSDENNDLWNFADAESRSIKKGITYLYPFVKHKKSWPLKPDVMFWNEWPVAQPFLIFGAVAFNNKEWFETWKQLDHAPKNEEVIRNLPVRNPLIWL